MKALVVAHPDDEIIWFAPQIFDIIVIAFLARHDKPYASYCRKQAIAAHPLKEKIILLRIEESGFWKDKNRVSQFILSKKILFDSLLHLKEKFSFAEIFTHNSQGEYGHDDHILVNEAVTAIFSKAKIFCPIESNNSDNLASAISVKNDLDFYFKVKEVYVKNRAWTWKNDYIPPVNLYYSLHQKHES